MEILLLRHGKTEGNLQRRYVGRTDEPILDSEYEKLQQVNIDFCPEQIYCSKMLRCQQTAQAVFGCDKENQLDVDPGKGHQRKRCSGYSEEICIWPGLEETDFGEFEYKNYEELKDDPRYQQWIDGGGLGAFPGGESGVDFRNRCSRAFSQIVENANTKKLKKIAIVAHGGTIMSIMDAYVDSDRTFYDWQPKNGHGYLISLSIEESMQATLEREV